MIGLFERWFMPKHQRPTPQTPTTDTREDDEELRAAQQQADEIADRLRMLKVEREILVDSYTRD